MSTAADLTHHEQACGADLVLCRECPTHFPGADVPAALRNFAASGSTRLLTVAEIPDGPLDASEPGKRLGLWRLGSHIPAGATRTIGR